MYIRHARECTIRAAYPELDSSRLEAVVTGIVTRNFGRIHYAGKQLLIIFLYRNM
jgi:hypothetical protein